MLVVKGLPIPVEVHLHRRNEAPVGRLAGLDK